MTVTLISTVGELRADPRTAPVIGRLMQEDMVNSFGEPGADEMWDAMMASMPLKSLMCFGMVPPEKVENWVSVLNETLSRE